MAETPAATAVDAQAAATAADEASRSAAEANVQAAVAAANAEEAARVRMAQIAEENQTRLNKFGEDIGWLRQNQEATASALTGIAEQNNRYQTELTEVRQAQATMAEALKNLLTPPPPEKQTEVKPPPNPSSADADARREAETKTQPQKRRIIRI